MYAKLRQLRNFASYETSRSYNALILRALPRLVYVNFIILPFLRFIRASFFASVSRSLLGMLRESFASASVSWLAHRERFANPRGPTLGEISYALGEITEIKI